MLKLIICGVLLAIVTDVYCKPDYQYYPKADGWFKLHKLTATWEEAFLQCKYEDAVLASPLTEEMTTVMTSLMSNSSSYFIGTHARFSPGYFVSVEGVQIENMPVSDMYEVLHSEDGECLSMNGHNITVVQCSLNLPYICYKSYESKDNLTVCGTFDNEYKVEFKTGSCYKVHKDLRSWSDAYSMCISEGGYLAILNDKEEARIVQKLIPDIKLHFTWNRKWDRLYIGLRDWNGNGTWLSIHGEAMDQLYNVWDEDQPDPSGQHCGALTRDGKLDNAWCHLVSYFVCEKDPINIRYESKVKNAIIIEYDN